MKNKKGFAIAGTLYPLLILFLALMALLLANLAQENYMLRRLNKDVAGKINEEEDPDDIVPKVEELLDETPSCTNYGVTNGAILPTFGYTGDTENLTGRFYKMRDGRTGVLIGDGTKCVYKTTSMQKLYVGEGNECEEIAEENMCDAIGLICPGNDDIEAQYQALFAQVTAEAGDVLTGKTFLNSNGEIVNGAMPNRGAVTQSLNPGGSYTIPAGYHNGSGVVTATANTGTYVLNSRGSAVDMGASNTYRYINTTNVPNTNSGTYSATARSASIDMGASNTYRYVNTTNVPNTNSETYTFASGSTGGTVDMGVTNSYRYVNAENVYNKGKADGQASSAVTLVSYGQPGGKGKTITGLVAGGKYILHVGGHGNCDGGCDVSVSFSGGTIITQTSGYADYYTVGKAYYFTANGTSVTYSANSYDGRTFYSLWKIG